MLFKFEGNGQTIDTSEQNFYLIEGLLQMEITAITSTAILMPCSPH